MALYLHQKLRFIVFFKNVKHTVISYFTFILFKVLDLSFCVSLFQLTLFQTVHYGGKLTVAEKYYDF